MFDTPVDVLPDRSAGKEGELERRLRVLLPDTYEVFDKEVQPRSMGSAELKFGDDRKVQWDSMWASFCDLAMAGGPPHRGTLLERPELAAAASQTDAYRAVVAEICRGIGLVTGLCAEASPVAGWVRMYCTSAAMNNWLVRAIVMENVSAVGSGLSLYLPAGPTFRIEKEIKNVITSVAKTCHFWQDHMSEEKHQAIAALVQAMDAETPLVPLTLFSTNADHNRDTADAIAKRIYESVGLKVIRTGSERWVGLECGSVSAAIWIMRALCVCNVLARREGSGVFVPVNAESDAAGERSAFGVQRAIHLAREYGVL